MLLISNANQADLFTNLPREIIIDILSCLPVGSIARCNCVCKSWRDLIKSSEFVATHHSTSTSSMSGLALIDSKSSNPFKIYEEIGVDGCTLISNFGMPTNQQDPTSRPLIKGSADGLLLLSDRLTNPFVCNPITREYIKLPPLPVDLPYKAKVGFGASKVTGQYKVVIYYAVNFKPCICSLETGLWRSINYNTACAYGYDNGTALVNGNLHWLECDGDPSNHHHHHQLLISCFDLETEQFTSFSLPRDHKAGIDCMISALESRLCLCHTIRSSDCDDKIVIWLMKKYGDESSWTKEEFIVNTPSIFRRLYFVFIYPVKVFRDGGDILFGRADDSGQLLFYSNKSRTIREYAHLQVDGYYFSTAVTYAPSFLSLRTMGFQNIASF